MALLKTTNIDDWKLWCKPQYEPKYDPCNAGTLGPVDFDLL